MFLLVIPTSPVFIVFFITNSSSVCKHYDNRHTGRILDDLRNCFNVLTKCQNKFDCLINEMFLIKQL